MNKNLYIFAPFLLIGIFWGLIMFLLPVNAETSNYNEISLPDCRYSDAYLPAMSYLNFVSNVEDEDNYSSESPTGPIRQDITYSGVISSDDAQDKLDIDFYYFQVTELGKIDFNFVGVNESEFFKRDGQVHLYYSGMVPSEVTKEHRKLYINEPAYTFSYEATQPGWYYLMVAGFLGKQSDFNYEFTVSFPDNITRVDPVNVPPCPTPTAVPAQDAVECQLPPRIDRHSYVIPFALDGYLISNGSLIEAETPPYEIEIPAGKYRVTLSSYDDHSTKVDDLAQEDERWHLIFYNSIDNEIALSNPIQDLPKDDDCKLQIVDMELDLIEDVAYVVARHTVYPGDLANSIVPDFAILTPVD
ncbi:MAG: hypothetical protein AAF490_05910 [Chloroflexota bacterium]